MGHAELVTRTSRRQVTLKDRLTACVFCGYPLSERHHVLPFAHFGENICTLQLCANCHELYHIVEGVVIYRRRNAAKLLKAFIRMYGREDIRLKKAYHFIAAAINIANEVLS